MGGAATPFWFARLASGRRGRPSAAAATTFPSYADDRADARAFAGCGGAFIDHGCWTLRPRADRLTSAPAPRASRPISPRCGPAASPRPRFRGVHDDAVKLGVVRLSAAAVRRRVPTLAGRAGASTRRRSPRRPPRLGAELRDGSTSDLAVELTFDGLGRRSLSRRRRAVAAGAHGLLPAMPGPVRDLPLFGSDRLRGCEPGLRHRRRRDDGLHGLPSLGGFLEPVGVCSTRPPRHSVAAGVEFYAPNNLIVQSSALSGPGWGTSNATVSGGVSDPFGGTAAFTMTATGANGQFWPSPFPNPLGAGNVINSIWLRRRSDRGLSTLTVRSGLGSPSTRRHRGSAFPSRARLRQALFPITPLLSSGCPTIRSTCSVRKRRPRPSRRQALTWVTSVSHLHRSAACVRAGARWSTLRLYARANSLVFATAPARAGRAIGASFSYAFQCRFEDDTVDFEEFMQSLWRVDSLKFRSVRTS